MYSRRSHNFTFKYLTFSYFYNIQIFYRNVTCCSVIIKYHHDRPCTERLSRLLRRKLTNEKYCQILRMYTIYIIINRYVILIFTDSKKDNESTRINYTYIIISCTNIILKYYTVISVILVSYIVYHNLCIVR